MTKACHGLLKQRIGLVYHNKARHLFEGLGRKNAFGTFLKSELSKAIQILHVVLFKYVKQCPVVFVLKFASFLRY